MTALDLSLRDQARAIADGEAAPEELLNDCLERISDYRDFERLCSALLAGAGYPSIEPLGGTGDKGRDAMIRIDDTGLRTVFAYTVRSDWRVKLDRDCSRVEEIGHKPDVFVFVCTEALSATEKDFAHQFVGTRLEYGA